MSYPIADAIRNKYGWKEVYDKDLIGDENGDCSIEFLNIDNQKVQDLYDIFTGMTYEDILDKMEQQQLTQKKLVFEMEENQ